MSSTRSASRSAGTSGAWSGSSPSRTRVSEELHARRHRRGPDGPRAADAGIVTNVSTITEATARLEAATAATALAARRVGRDRRHVLDAADLEARARERAQRRLGAGARRLRLVAARRADLDVQRRHAELLAAHGYVLRGKHGRVGRRLVAVGLDFHAARHADERFTARQISDVHERVVERREDVRDAEQRLALRELGAQGGHLLDYLGFFGHGR